MRKKVVIIISILIILVAFFGLGRQIFNALESGKHLDVITGRLSNLQEENRKLQNQLTQVQKPDFVEQQARNKLNLVRPNETIVVIPDSQINKILGLNKKMPEINLPNWQGWLKLFGI